MPPDYVLFIIIIIICSLSMYKELWLLMTQPKSPGRTDGSVQEDDGPLRCNPSFQKQHHATKKYINPSLT